MSDIHEWNLATWEECGHGYKCSDGCPTCRITLLEEEVERLREDNRNLIRAHDEMSDQAQQEMKLLRDEVRDLRQMHPCEKCQARERETRHLLTRLVRRLEKITPMGTHEAFGEFQQGSANGWNQCRAQVIAAITETQVRPVEE